LEFGDLFQAKNDDMREDPSVILLMNWDL